MHSAAWRLHSHGRVGACYTQLSSPTGDVFVVHRCVDEHLPDFAPAVVTPSTISLAPHRSLPSREGPADILPPGILLHFRLSELNGSAGKGEPGFGACTPLQAKRRAALATAQFGTRLHRGPTSCHQGSTSDKEQQIQLAYVIILTAAQSFQCERRRKRPSSC